MNDELYGIAMAPKHDIVVYDSCTHLLPTIEPYAPELIVATGGEVRDNFEDMLANLIAREIGATYLPFPASKHRLNRANAAKFRIEKRKSLRKSK